MVYLSGSEFVCQFVDGYEGCVVLDRENDTTAYKYAPQHDDHCV